MWRSARYAERVSDLVEQLGSGELLAALDAATASSSDDAFAITADAKAAESVRRDPETSSNVSSVVATTLGLTDREAIVTSTAAIKQRHDTCRSGDATSGPSPAGPAELGVFRLESEDLIGQARRLHANAYLDHGHHTADSVGVDGFLIDAIDPPELVARSTYLGVLDNEGLLGGCIRMIQPAGGDPTTLPTVKKLVAHRRPNEPALTGLPFPFGSTIFELSGLAKSGRCHDRSVTTRLLLAACCEGRRLGGEYGIMGIPATIASLLISVYGDEAIRPVHAALGTITEAGKGIRPDGLTLIGCYADMATFVGDLLVHCRAHPHNARTRINQPLIELAAASFPRSADQGSSSAQAIGQYGIWMSGGSLPNGSVPSADPEASHSDPTAEIVAVDRLEILERLVVSPTAGIFQPSPAIAPGGHVTAGTILGVVGDHDVRCPFDGILQDFIALPGERLRSLQPIAWLRTVGPQPR